ncbi:hypothetical protein E2562_035575 [Oryza meyeriana var. granulata]|uniref:C2H2-type domain-containing protein n=1 Tax=Oryza meyeriana var. granulata TaxID=110450 RepID=A0A6G1ESS4_9ORYZ|nr:hypothetical protein E2562_035575 [Oryza meyeriana var. granulata]
MGAATSSSTRPYYECVFCKRGFTTAQALGGHMNIHRRDRAKPGAARDTSSTPTGITSVSRNVECYSQYRRQAYAPSSMAVVSSGAGGSSSSSFAMYYGSAAGVDGAAAIGPRELSLFDAATTTPDQGLHLGVGRRGAGESRAPEGSEQQPGELPERELDLELRLGRHTNRYH